MSIYSNLLGLYRSNEPLFIDGFRSSLYLDEKQYCYICFFHNPSYVAIYFSNKTDYSKYYEPNKLNNSGNFFCERNSFEFNLISPEKKESLICSGYLESKKIVTNIRINRKTIHSNKIFNKVSLEEIRQWRNPEKYKSTRSDSKEKIPNTHTTKSKRHRKFKYRKKSTNITKSHTDEKLKFNMSRYLIACLLFILVTYIMYKNETFNFGGILRTIGKLIG